MKNRDLFGVERLQQAAILADLNADPAAFNKETMKGVGRALVGGVAAVAVGTVAGKAAASAVVGVATYVVAAAAIGAANNHYTAHKLEKLTKDSLIKHTR